ncbi:MAG: alpha/beta hydrolase [Betaproteobacteria bacterium]|nr:alpha/beta hydrolase [Betaproteobacteria bacterium]
MTPSQEADYITSEYNPRLSIPNVPEIFARWVAAGAAARAASPRAKLDLAYGQTEGERLDLFPAAEPGAPLLVFIHGGYWRAMDKSDFSWVAPAFAERGISVALPNYTLVPKVSIEEIVRQILRSLAWLWRHGERLGFDPNRIVVSGHSAGGHLTGMALAARWPKWEADLPKDLVKAGLAMSALFDLRPLIKSPFFNNDFKLDDAQARKLSPALMTPATRAPIMTTVGGDESGEFHRQNGLVRERWPRAFAGDIAMPGYNHLTLCDALAEPGNPLFEAAARLCLATGNQR